MLNKDGIVNPIAAADSRRLWQCPPHFTRILMQSDIPDDAERNIRWWLYENIEGRFFLGMSTTQKGNILKEGFIVAFENPADATYFNLIKSKVVETPPEMV